MAAFYANENFPLPVVEALRSLGHDVLTTNEAGKGDQRIPDEEVLGYSIRERRAVLTLNRKHFTYLHRRHDNPPHEGIIVCTADLDFDGQAQRIHDEILKAGSLQGKLLRVNRPHEHE